MSQISKCPKITVVLSYWEALGEVSELSYKSLLYSTSVGSYCSNYLNSFQTVERGGSNALVMLISDQCYMLMLVHGYS